MFQKILLKLKGEKILLFSGLCAVITMFLVPVDMDYLSYIDVRVLCLLFSLMVVILGFQKCGAFQWLSSRMIQKSSGGKMLGFSLVMLPFFSSMLVTNDVALLTFVPFTLLLLHQIHCERSTIFLLVLQTIAANLGSMATPVGNPQNLFLYAKYELSIKDFFFTMTPFTLISFLLLAIASFFVLPKNQSVIETEEKFYDKKKLLSYGILFLLCLLTVFRVLPYPLLVAVVFFSILYLDRSILKEIDYGLLATFVCFFIVSGNLGRIDFVKQLLCLLLSKNTLLTSAAASQFISNVPSAVLLSGFTNDWRSLLLGVNIGGLGTPVASLASLITIKLYLSDKDAKPLKFLTAFTLLNTAGLLILLFAAMI